nr:MAG TPA: hypothetical protein [Caudoviricetes sp.]
MSIFPDGGSSAFFQRVTAPDEMPSSLASGFGFVPRISHIR